MEIPLLTSEGFVGQRMIIDDYFIAGERLNAGDVVGVMQDTEQNNEPREFRIRPGMDSFRAIGIVHTPVAKEVGDRVAGATSSDSSAISYVPIVVKGLAKALSAGSIRIGDPVTPAVNVVTLAGKGNVARVQVAGENSDPIVGRSLSSVLSANQVIDVLVDLAGGIAETNPSDTVEHLGTLTQERRIGACAEWSTAQESVNNSGAYAKFVSFTLEIDTDIYIRLQ